MTEYEFTVVGGETIVNGKPTWPDYLTLTMTRDQAVGLCIHILSQLKHMDDPIVWSQVGELRELGDR